MSGAKYFSTSRRVAAFVDVAHDREACVVGRVILLEEPFHIVETHSLDVGVRSNHARVVGMRLRKERVIQRLFDNAIRLVLDRLPPLVANDVLLVGKVRLIHLVEQIPHAIGLEPQREVQLVGGQRFEVVGPIEVRCPVDAAGARALEHLEVHVRGDVLRPLEHHVLEQVCEAAAAGHLVAGADVVPDVDGDRPRSGARITSSPFGSVYFSKVSFGTSAPFVTFVPGTGR